MSDLLSNQKTISNYIKCKFLIFFMFGFVFSPEARRIYVANLLLTGIHLACGLKKLCFLRWRVFSNCFLFFSFCIGMRSSFLTKFLGPLLSLPIFFALFDALLRASSLDSLCKSVSHHSWKRLPSDEPRKKADCFERKTSIREKKERENFVLCWE